MMFDVYCNYSKIIINAHLNPIKDIIRFSVRLNVTNVKVYFLIFKHFLS